MIDLTGDAHGDGPQRMLAECAPGSFDASQQVPRNSKRAYPSLWQVWRTLLRLPFAHSGRTNRASVPR
jgi:hypothetical protein